MYKRKPSLQPGGCRVWAFSRQGGSSEEILWNCIMGNGGFSVVLKFDPSR